AEEIYAQAGDWVAITSPARFRWLAGNRPELFRRIAHIGMLGDWLATRLTGNFSTDPSLGSSSGMFDLASRSWCDRILGIVGLETDLMPRVTEPGTVTGEGTTRAAEACGVPAGTPVVTGGADTQLGLVGIGVRGSGRTTVVGGSFWQHTGVLDQPLI